ncbi:MAG: hypothetical protein ABIQ32_07795 [Sphingomicrobium sp.]
MIVGIVGGLVTLASGYGMLKGFSWSRLLYVGWSIFSLIFGYVAMPMISGLVLGIIFLAVIAFFLFRPAANAWFAHGAVTDHPDA